jgi:Uma2 family endonuclease
MSESHEDQVERWLQARTSPEPTGATRQELLDGDQVFMPPHSDAHVACVNRLTKLLTQAVGDRATVSVQNPITLDEQSEPVPDVALVSTSASSSGRANPKDILLLIEVSDSSFALTHDRGRKAAAYARSGIPECWIVDLTSRQMLIHGSPASGGYRDIRNLRADATLTVSALPGVSLSCSDVLDG